VELINTMTRESALGRICLFDCRFLWVYHGHDIREIIRVWTSSYFSGQPWNVLLQH